MVNFDWTIFHEAMQSFHEYMRVIHVNLAKVNRIFQQYNRKEN